MLAILRVKALLHPELRAPLTWNGLRAILRRERIQLEHAEIATPAALITFRGRPRILLNPTTSIARHSYYVAHELAHWWAHGEAEPVYYVGDESPNAIREDEADDMATWMLGSDAVRRALEDA